MTPTLKKLRYQPGMRVAVVSAPSDFEAELGKAKDLTRVSGLAGPVDLVQAFYTRKADFDRDAKKLAGALGPKGILWVCYPKGKALDTDLNRDILHAAGAKHRLDGVSLVSVDDVWSALRFKPL